MAAGILSWDPFSICARETTDGLRQEELRELRGLKAALQKDRQEVRRLARALLRRPRLAKVTVRFKRAGSNRRVDMEGTANSEGRSITTSTWSDGCTPTPEPVSPRSIDVAVRQNVQGEPDSEQSPTSQESSERKGEDQDVTQLNSSGSSEPGCQWGLGMDSTCISGVVILLIVSSMILLAFEADSCARYGLHDIPDSFMWANLVVFLLFTLEMGFRLRRCPRPEVLLVLDMVVIFMQAVDVGVSLVARFAAGSEVRATAYLRIAQYLRWFRIVRCLHFIPAFASMKVQMDLIKGAVVPLLSAVFVLFFSISTVATLVTAVVAEDCRQPDVVGPCGEHFESIWESMYNVFMGTFGGLDFDDLVRPIRSVSPLACIIISVYMTLIYLMMMTVLTAHLCQKAVETASADQVEGRLKKLFQEITGGRHRISLDRFTEALKDPRIKELFEQLDISTEDVRKRARRLFKLIDKNQDKDVEEREFVHGIMRLRGPAKNLKLWEVQWEMQSELSRIRHDQSQIRLEQSETRKILERVFRKKLERS
ncbi:unnamed protein product [Symbiodinium natans]|uniref:EF-hand domain-containing protein n=1 Tax=Symbiodinium natans TaxID=878477 RepID=A0A812SL13_9DINO|nr:unnamed protein product [Symbiodinium natans]